MRRKVRLYAYTMVDRYTMLSGSQAGCRTDNRSTICGVSGTQTSSISKRQVQGVNAAIYFLRIHGVEQVEEMAEKVKVKEADLYSAFIEVLYTQGAQVRITQCYTCKLHRTCLYLVSTHQMAHPGLRLRTSNCSLLLIYLPRKDERLSWPRWLVT